MSALYSAITANWEIQQKIVAMVIDNAANMRAAVRMTGYTQIACTAHTLQLAIHDALDNNLQVQNILSKSRAIVGHFKRSNIDKAKLVEKQIRFKMKIMKLIQEVNFFRYNFLK